MKKKIGLRQYDVVEYKVIPTASRKKIAVLRYIPDTQQVNLSFGSVRVGSKQVRKILTDFQNWWSSRQPREITIADSQVSVVNAFNTISSTRNIEYEFIKQDKLRTVITCDFTLEYRPASNTVLITGAKQLRTDARFNNFMASYCGVSVKSHTLINETGRDRYYKVEINHDQKDCYNRR